MVAVALLMAGCSSSRAPSATPTTATVASSDTATSSESGTVPVTTGAAGLAPGPYGFLVPTGWVVGKLQNYGGPASFAHVQGPAPADWVDYELDGTGSVYGSDRRPDMSRLLAASHTADWGAGPLGCPLTGEQLASADEILYRCASPLLTQVVVGVMAVQPYPEGFRLLQVSLPEQDYAEADQIVASLPPPSGDDPLSMPPGCRAGALTADAYPGSGAGGQESVVVVITHPGADPCSLSGYPSVWFESASGSPIGPHSIHEGTPVGPPPVVVHGTVVASATVWTGNPQVPAPGYCEPTRASRVTVVPPGDIKGLSASVQLTMCAAHAVVGVTPLVSGDLDTLF
jgi:hypothetical protein